jgi:transposase
MGSTHFLTKRLKNVKTEISLHVLAYKLKLATQILGTPSLVAAIRA